MSVEIKLVLNDEDGEALLTAINYGLLENRFVIFGDHFFRIKDVLYSGATPTKTSIDYLISKVKG